MSAQPFNTVVDLLLPQPCFLCGGDSVRGLLCAACEIQLPMTGLHSCEQCAQPLERRGLCGRCVSKPPAFDSSMSVFEYRFPVSDMIQRLKYHGDLYLAGQLGKMLLGVSSLDGVDVIIPMPLHRARLRQRGFNQAFELARPLARASGIPMPVGAVLRVRDTLPQAGLDLVRRKRNLRGAFGCMKSFAGLSVLVVDDVMTTGATLNELARTLKTAGACRVRNLVLARTPAEH